MGEHDLSKEEDSSKYSEEPFIVQDIDIETAVAYPKYDRAKQQNDIGLIRLKSPANLEKPNIRTICLPVEEDNQFEQLDDIDAEIKAYLNIAG